ncbi:MAG: hypothetical protein JO093_24040 [Acidobacteria bacterium]|nr:hypothetical protein [Acidobacteriota bacterium]MBV9070727.1 hypothetical protein [Acidobacteriota bacterium]MBV9188701.1 hypothetical protein [Acidobacteriota bacterium]
MQHPPPLVVAHLRQLRPIRIERFEQLRRNTDAFGEGEALILFSNRRHDLTGGMLNPQI